MLALHHRNIPSIVSGHRTDEAEDEPPSDGSSDAEACVNPLQIFYICLHPPTQRIKTLDRFVLHRTVPTSQASALQRAGRAGPGFTKPGSQTLCAHSRTFTLTSHEARSSGIADHQAFCFSVQRSKKSGCKLIKVISFYCMHMSARQNLRPLGTVTPGHWYLILA